LLYLLLKAFLFFTISVFSYAQSGNDKRGYQGTVTSAAKQIVRADGKEDASVKTDIEFTGRAINVEGEVYEIVKKTFDGKNKTVFTCTKRRGTFEITYAAGASISVVDTGNTDVTTIYSSLTEK
jgi:hypothetical protein